MCMFFLILWLLLFTFYWKQQKTEIIPGNQLVPAEELEELAPRLVPKVPAFHSDRVVACHTRQATNLRLLLGRIEIFSPIQMTKCWAVSWRTAVCPQPLQSRQKKKKKEKATVILNWLAVTLTWWWTLPPRSCNTSTNWPEWLVNSDDTKIVESWSYSQNLQLSASFSLKVVICGSGQTIIGSWIVHNHL